MEQVYDKVLIFLENRFTYFSKNYPDLYILTKERKIGINNMEQVYDKILLFLENRFTHFSKNYPDLYILIKERKIGINNIYINKEPLLIHVATENNINLATSLLYHGCNVNLKGYEAWLPLHLSVMYDNVELVKLFLEYDANINIKTKSNSIPLDINVYSSTNKELRRNIALLNVLNGKN